MALRTRTQAAVLELALDVEPLFPDRCLSGDSSEIDVMDEMDTWSANGSQS